MTDEDLALLREHAVEDEEEPGKWRLDDAIGPSRSPKLMAAYIRACLYLGTPVTNILTMDFISSLVTKVAEMERRLADRGAEGQ